VSAAVVVSGLTRSFGATRALDGVDLEVEEGTILGLLGPNGAGKTTAVRILTTLLRPDAGTATILGLDVVRRASEVRPLIGLAGQYAAVDELLTGRENLRLFGRLYHRGKTFSAARADELLERFDLADAADRVVRTYSGGMRRRLDLAASLVNSPRVLFLDEPTTGLDPRSRLALWGIIQDLVADGTTLLLTTQYLEEADRLAHRIAVIDVGRVIAEGTADQLKEKVGGELLVIRVADNAQADDAIAVLGKLRQGEPTRDAESVEITMPVTNGVAIVVKAAAALQKAGVSVAEIAMRRPTLDDVFLTLTGHAAEVGADDEDAAPVAQQGRRGRKSA
jgi:ABC-2 type transport system ATP-binding protein